MNIIEEIRKIPIKDIIKLRIPVHGNDALCPFHEDRKRGSFKISDKKNIFKCFSCNTSGDGISFISKYDHISYKDAAYQIALELELISKDEYDKRNIVRTEIVPVKMQRDERKDESADIQSEEILNMVYSKICNSELSEKDREYLLGRGLTQDDLNLGKYFTMPNETDVMKKTSALCKSLGVKKDFLLGVPGFYKYNDRIRFSSIRGIGIPIYNYDNEIIGIQVRNSTKANGSRYLWISSSFADGTDGKVMGTGPGTPIGVIVPKEIKNNNILITEGNFKAIKYANKFGSIAITVQGVNSFFGIKYVLRTLSQDYFNEEPLNVLIGYDADMIENTNVFKASLNLYREIRYLDVKIKYLIWNEKYGKGLDDLIISNNEDKLNLINAKEYQYRYINCIKRIQKENPDNSNNLELIKKSLIEEFKLD